MLIFPGGGLKALVIGMASFFTRDMFTKTAKRPIMKEKKPMARSSTKRADVARVSPHASAANAPTAGGFAALLEESFGKSGGLEGTVVKGIVRSIEKEFIIVDVGLKSEGRIPLREFAVAGQPADCPGLHHGGVVGAVQTHGDMALARDHDRTHPVLLKAAWMCSTWKPATSIN